MAVTVNLAPYSDENGNTIEYQGPRRDDVKVLFRGSNNSLVVAADVNIQKGFAKFSFDQSNSTITVGGGRRVLTRPLIIVGEDCSVSLGRNVSSTSDVYIRVAEGKKVTIGDDVMIASRVEIRADDSHPIFDIESGERANPSSDVTVGSHVWLANGAIVLGGVTIGEGSVVGINSVVTRSLPNNVVATGSPAKIVRRDIAWERPNLTLTGPYFRDASSVDKSKFWFPTGHPDAFGHEFDS